MHEAGLPQVFRLAQWDALAVFSSHLFDWKDFCYAK